MLTKIKSYLIFIRVLTLVGVMIFPVNAANAQVTFGDDVPAIELNVESYEVVGFNPLSENATRKLLKKYTGSFANLDTIYDAAKTLEDAIHRKGYSFASVSLPEQPVTNSTIKLRIDGFTIASIEAKNNKYFSLANVRRSAPALVENENPNLKELQRSLSVVNLHPAKRVSVHFLSSDKDALFVDATLTVSDKYPKQYFAWLNDTGSEDTGEYRLGVGFQNSNLFDRDHTATVTYTTSPDQVEDVAQIGLNYRIPLYKAGGIIDLLAFNSDIDTGRVAEVFNVSGRGETYRAGYTHILHNRGGYSHQIYAAIEDKLFDNEVTFEGVEVVPDVRSRPLIVGYQNTWRARGGHIKNRITVSNNLSSGSFNTDADYNAARSGASQDWQVFRYSGTVDIPAGKGRVIVKFNTQISSEPLITGEQFGIGGQSSVRGFDERELTGDSGYFTSLQYWTPPRNGLKFVGFLDYGKIDRENALPGEISQESISSTGAGLRWSSKDDRWTVRLDLAHVLEGADPLGAGTTRDGDNRAHFNILYRR